MKIYISGKITGTTDFEKRFKRAEDYLKSKGFDVLNPIDFCKDIDKNSDWTVYMRRCVKMLADADMIYMLKDWNNSKGAIIERWLAHALKIDVSFEEYIK